MSKSIIIGALGAVTLSMAASAGFTGFTLDRVVNLSGRPQYSIYATFDNLGLPQGKRWIFLGVRDFRTVYGSMSARHRDAATESD